MLSLRLTSIAFAAVVIVSAQSPAPAPPAGPANVYATNYVLQTVADLDRSVAYYQEVFGFEVKNKQTDFITDRDFRKVIGAKGTKMRSALIKLPGTFDLKLVQYQGHNKLTGKWATRTPGDINLDLHPRDVPSLFAETTKRGATVLTASGAPMKRAGGNLIVFMVDPDGFQFELEQAAAGRGGAVTSPPPDTKVQSATLGTTLAIGEKSGPFFSALGFAFRLGAAFVNDDPSRLDLLGASGGSIRASNITLPETKLGIFGFEFHGIDQPLFQPKTDEPGARALSIKVHDIDAALQAVKANGGTVISADGKAVTVKSMDNAKVAWVKSPDGLTLELTEAAH